MHLRLQILRQAKQPSLSLWTKPPQLPQLLLGRTNSTHYNNQTFTATLWPEHIQKSWVRTEVWRRWSLYTFGRKFIENICNSCQESFRNDGRWRFNQILRIYTSRTTPIHNPRSPIFRPNIIQTPFKYYIINTLKRLKDNSNYSDWLQYGKLIIWSRLKFTHAHLWWQQQTEWLPSFAIIHNLTVLEYLTSAYVRLRRQNFK